MHMGFVPSLSLVIGIALCACSGQGRVVRHHASTAPAVKWGDQRSGLRFRIWTTPKAFGRTDAIPLHYAVENTSSTPRNVWHAYFWSNHIIEVTAPDGHPAKLTQAGENARKDAASGTQEKTYPFSLPPRATDLNWPITNLRDYFVFDASGRYLVECIYNNRTIKMTSNSLTVVVHK